MRLVLISLLATLPMAVLATARAFVPAMPGISFMARGTGSGRESAASERRQTGSTSGGSSRSGMRPAVAHAAIGRAEPARYGPRSLDVAVGRLRGNALTIALVIAICAISAGVRLWRLDAVGFNSDEAVYAGQAASIAHHPDFRDLFPTFRAHPLLYQTFLSIGFHLGWTELFARVVSALVGVATVLLVFEIGRNLYNRHTGIVAALFMGLMPYHVVVTRQVLLDGPLTFFTTLTLYTLVRLGQTNDRRWLFAAGGAMGLTFLAKETGIILMGSIFAFLALTPSIRLRIRDVLFALGIMFLVILPYPLSVQFAGKSETSGQYLAWQLFRRANHGLGFYPTEVSAALGYLVIAAALIGLVLLRRRLSWRETLLVSWIIVPVCWFELWPVKGFQYLLPIAPAVALLAASALTSPTDSRAFHRHMPTAGVAIRTALVAIVGVSLFLPTWQRIQPPESDKFLAGSGGVPGGREAGEWIEANTPKGSRVLAIGPSMANIVQYYGHRKAYGLSVSPNPLHRNPSYDPVRNPDLQIRRNDLQYIVWDSFSADRSEFFSAGIMKYVDRYNGRIVHQETVPATDENGNPYDKPIIIIYEVRP